MDYSTVVKRRASTKPTAEGGWNIFLTWWNGMSSSDPVGNLAVGASCEKAYPGWPCDAAHQALIDEFGRTVDLAKRKEIAIEIQESAMKLVPYVPLGMWYQPVALSPRLKNVINVPGAMVFWGATKAGK